MIQTARSRQTIDCGIGEINYSQPDIILLQVLMDNFKELLEHFTPLEVNQFLEQKLKENK